MITALLLATDRPVDKPCRGCWLAASQQPKQHTLYILRHKCLLKGSNAPSHISCKQHRQHDAATDGRAYTHNESPHQRVGVHDAHDN
jgi:hypothetical protein